MSCVSYNMRHLNCHPYCQNGPIMTDRDYILIGVGAPPFEADRWSFPKRLPYLGLLAK
jgi:hypothetical protein